MTLILKVAENKDIVVSKRRADGHVDPIVVLPPETVLELFSVYLHDEEPGSEHELFIPKVYLG